MSDKRKSAIKKRKKRNKIRRKCNEKGIMLKDWFADEVSMEEMAAFLREYDVFGAHKNKEWTNKRIRTVRELIKMLTVK